MNESLNQKSLNLFFNEELYLLNSVVDDIWVVYGSFIGYKIGFFNSIKLYLTILFLQKVCGFDSGIDIVIEVVSHFFPTNKNKNNKNKNNKNNKNKNK